MRRFAAWLLVLVTCHAFAAGAPAPVDRDYPGTLQLRVDATDIDRRILRVEERIPVSPGTVTLHYPQWLPGNHAPRGPIEQLAGLVIRAGDRTLDWERDPDSVHSFRVRVPRGVSALDVSFQVATPQASDQGRIVITARLLNLQWNQVVLYPAGYYARRIPVAAELRLPPDWKAASSLLVLPGGPSADGWLRFATVPLETLVDSPLFAGVHAAQFDLTATAPGGSPSVRLNVFAESPTDIAVTPEQLAIHRALVRETYAALGAPRYDRYEFLLALTENLGGIGLEHLRSSENTHSPTHFRSWDENVGSHDLLAHEFVHSWNGKYRRPARLWTPHYNVPMQNHLLWVYEGMTEFYGYVLATRSGFWSPEFTRDFLAATAAIYDRRRPGRQWRPLEDTTWQPVISARRPLSWTSWQRAEDYYSESTLLWLDVDMRLRELTGGARGLDDFARAFFSAPASEGEISTYELRDVAAALRAVAPFDWERLLRERVTRPGAPLLDGLERAGWRLAYGEEPNQAIRDSERSRRTTDLSYSLGVVLSSSGVMTEVVWESPAYHAGLATNTTLVAVNGRAWSADLLKQAINDAKGGGQPIELLVRNQDCYRTVRIDYRDGLRYPRLERIEGREDRLAELLRARAATP